MRTTVRIEEDLLRDLKKRASAEKASLTDTLNEMIRRGLRVEEAQAKKKRRFRQKTYDMGEPLVDISKALTLAGQLEDEETLRKLAQHK